MLSAIGLGALLAALLVASFGSLTRRSLFLGTGVILAVISLSGPRARSGRCSGMR